MEASLVLSTPGAAPDGTFGLISFRGISGLLNNNTVDGGDNTGVRQVSYFYFARSRLQLLVEPCRRAGIPSHDARRTTGAEYSLRGSGVGRQRRDEERT